MLAYGVAQLEPAPDDRTVQAAAYGPVVLSGAYGRAATAMPRLRPGSLTRAGGPLTFSAKADGRDVRLLPVARTQHQHQHRLLEDRLSSVTATTAAGGSRLAAWRDR